MNNEHDPYFTSYTAHVVPYNLNELPKVDNLYDVEYNWIETTQHDPVEHPNHYGQGSIEAIDAINVRSEPSLDGTILGGLYLGETAEVLARSDDGEWWQIEYANAPGQPAWVAAEFVTFSGQPDSVPISGVGTVTPTPGPTPVATSTPAPTAASTIVAEQPTLAPTATSIYEATSAAMLASRGTPEPLPGDGASAEQETSSFWENIPWGILSVLVIAGFLYYQYIQRRRRW